ncbi:hypothetical protein Esti_004527 [Eimeria stiedai]
MAVLWGAAGTAALSLAVVARAAAAAAAPAAAPASAAAAAAAAARFGLLSTSASAVRHGAPLVQSQSIVSTLKASGAPLSQGPLLHGLQQPTVPHTNSSSSSNNNNSSRWFVPSLPGVLQRQQLLELGSSSIHFPLSRDPLMWGPLSSDVAKLPVGNPCGGPVPISLPAETPLEGPPSSFDRTSPVSEPPSGTSSAAHLGAPFLKGDCEGPLEYRCNKGVDLLKLKSLRWGEVSKGPWGSAIGG